MPSIPLKLPKIGESVSEATISQWFKKEGDTIEKDEIFVEITTDKVTSELPSEYKGVLKKILIPQNEVANIGQAIAELEVSEKDYLQYTSKNDTIDNILEVNQPKKADNELFNMKEFQSTFLSPVVRKMIAINQISLQELEQISPSGNEGRITKKDIQDYLNKKKEIPTEKTTKLLLPIADSDTVVPIIGIRKKTAEVLTESYREIPHVTTVVEMDVSKMVHHRNTSKQKYFQEYGLKLTYTHYCMYAVIQALQKYPELNAWYNVDEWILKKQINLGFATALPNNILIVPNIKNAEDISFKSLVEKINQMAKKAKQNQLSEQDFADCTFTVSNTGIFGSLMGTPIITKPQVAVLALGEIQEDIQMNPNGEIQTCKKMYASLSYDHRVINGALASKFLIAIKQLLNEDIYS